MLQPSPPTPSVWYRNDSLRPSAPVQTKTENQGQPKRKLVERKALRTAALLNNTNNAKTKRPQLVDLQRTYTTEQSQQKATLESERTSNLESKGRNQADAQNRRTHIHTHLTEDRKTRGNLTSSNLRMCSHMLVLTIINGRGTTVP